MGTALLLLPGRGASGEAWQKLEAKEAFTRGFPQYFLFRGEYNHAAHQDYVTWAASLKNAAGVIRKFVPEELPNINKQSPEWADRYATEHPEKLLLLHLNGEARQVMGFPEVLARYFPGHWIHEPGALLTTDAAAEDSVLQVENARPFKVQAYVDREGGKGKSWFPHHVLLVGLDERGNRLWNESEYVIIKSVDYQRNTLTVERGQFCSRPRAHAATRTYVAPMAADVWGRKPMWYYNLSSTCPRDNNGQNAADVFIGEMAQWFSASGPLRRFNGIAFDVNYRYVKHPGWDTDNDGRSDAGIVNGKNVWEEGDWYFLTRLRKALGDNRLITCDGEYFENQQAVGVLDGIESEGLLQHNDGFRGFSRMINTHLYWAANSNRKHDFRYVVLKLKNPLDEKRAPQLRRLAIGAACCVGAMNTGAAENPLPAGFAAAGSLGFPKAPLVRYAAWAPDLLKGAKPDALLPRLEAAGCSLQPQGSALAVTPASGGGPMKITLKNLAVPAGDLTLFLEMEAVDPLEGFAKEARVPRAVHARFSKVPDYGEGRYNEMYTNLYGYMGTHGYSTISYYLRRPKTGPETLDVTFQIQGRGRVNLRSLTAHNAPDILVREFDRGVVVVNPALESVTVPVGKFVRGARDTTVPSLDAAFLTQPE